MSIFCFVLVAGCASAPPLTPRPSLQVANLGALPTPGRTDLIEPAREYVIGAFDKLNIDVYGIEDLKREKIEVDASGRIGFPFAGSVKAAGITPGELADLLTERLRKFVRDPQVTVNVVEGKSSAITVDGQVRKPGLYPVVGRMTLNRAIASAEGLTDFARVQEVVVFRTVGGKDYAALYDLGAIRRGAYGDPEIFANDIIIVGDSPQRRLLRDLVAITPLIVAPLITVLAR
ncbi:MAG: polysaccharide export protein [Sphingomonas sp.]|nr:polysaccharide export protein [Sphingomonas sp.]